MTEERAKIEKFDFARAWEVLPDLVAALYDVDRNVEAKDWVEELHRTWEERKARLLEALGPNGRVGVSVENTKDGDGTVSLDTDAVSAAFDRAYEWAGNRFGGPQLGRVRQVLDWVEHTLPAPTLVAGRTVEAWTVAERRFPAGTKLGTIVRAIAEAEPARFGRWWGEATEEERAASIQPALDALSVALSALRAVKLTLVLSVNPVDMLLASEHTSGWDSCYRSGGQWATGPTAYLLDECTAIAYAYRRYGEPGFGWGHGDLPVKAWRAWVHFDFTQAVAVINRQYPEEREHISAPLRSLAADVLSSATGRPKKWAFKRHGGERWISYVGWNYADPPSQRVRLVPPGADAEKLAEPSYFRVGAEYIPCLGCGEWRADDSRHGTLHCASCDGTVVCSRCGGTCYEDEATEAPDGDILCGGCAETLLRYCDRCDTVTWRDELVQVYVDDAGCVAWWCESCAGDYAAHCEACNDVFADGLLVYVEPLEADYCLECLERVLRRHRIVQCYTCGEYVYEAEAYFGGDGWCCADCAPEEEEEERVEVMA